MELEVSEWPKGLEKVKPGIKNIFYKGNIGLLSDGRPRLAVVGSRKMTDYGREIIDRWVPTLVKHGVVIVSGFMYGVDQEAHRVCLEEGGSTIAVLGWGIDKKVARLDEKLYQKILESDGLIVSEYPGVTPARIWTFPQRDRIVVGISDAVWVVEGALKSGSMITANQATAQGKPLLALPGRVGVNVAEGVNGLIKMGRAEMVTGVGDLFEVLGLVPGQLSLG